MSLLRTALLTIAFAPALSAQALPTAKDLMDKHDAAIGSRASLASHASFKQAGSMSIPAAGMDATIEIFKEKSGRYVQRVSLGAMGEVVTGFDGKNGWSVQPGAGAALLDSATTRDLKDQADFFAAFHDASRYKSAETIGIVDFDGRKCYKVKIVRMAGGEGFEYFDVATGLSAGAEREVDTPGGKMQTTTIANEYKDFGGFKIATKITQKLPQYEAIVNLTVFEFDKVDAAVFALPESLKASAKP
jgi:hypothetical protein